MATTTAGDGATLSFDVTGSGPPLVLVHGITESSAAWDPLVAPLAERHQVVTLDLRGHGRSAVVGPFEPLTFARDVQVVMEAAGVGDDAVLVGHSLGGVVVAACAAALPCRGVVDVDQPLALGGFQEGLRAIEPMLRGDDESFRAAVGLVLGSLAGPLDDVQRGRLEALRRPDRDVVMGVWSVVLDNDAAAVDALVASFASNIHVPFLSLHGSDPGPGYAAWLTALVPTATVEVWDGLGHWLHLVDPERFVERVERFASSV